MTNLIAPENCTSMADLRVQIDAIDVQLITLLKTRSGYIDRAVDLKRIENLPARTTNRVAEVLGKVSATAEAKGLDPTLVRTLWTELIEWSIAQEAKELDA
ncbi:chorismate mutase [Shimia aestuarii]|uniref:chorismate mutase n=1 Tax=Shimia aestuarii TaxID=254406 RepID=A0A1I4JUX8_9RHOB|nr:chorismate mutase family protein [Shimia aestuarii]SFL70369.1 isochorismate pyruvate lyase [Shimia aestuarii]